MWKCQKCGEQQKQGVQPVRAVVETREATYPYRAEANRGVDDPGGKGTEIVREENRCEACAETLEWSQASMKALG